MNVKIWYKNLKCSGSMIFMHKVHNKWQFSRDIDEVQSVFDIHWQDEALRRHEIAYNILKVKFEEFYQNKKFTCEKWGYICPTLLWFYPPIGCSCLVFSKQKNFFQLDVHVWCLARKKTSNCCHFLFDRGLSHVLFHKSNFNLILLCDWSQFHDTLDKLGYSYLLNFTYSAFFSKGKFIIVAKILS